ncbi:MAG TPA: hypothetical protein VMG32_11505 [Anaeromyxobacteraceae bacterium]|nr:hypothetical protein [Anaeromyxobacteraceae bacterium]
MHVDLAEKSWLLDLVDALLKTYDPAAALLRLPPELRGADPEGPSLEARARTLLVRSMRRKFLDQGPAGAAESGPAAEDAFLGPIEGHLGLALDIALVHGAPFERGRRRAELLALCAALVGLFDALRAADPARPGGGATAAVRRAAVRAGAELKARDYPAGDPKGGLALRVGVLSIQRRHLARLAIAYYGGGLDLATARRFHEVASGDAALLVEALVGLASAPGALGPRRRRICLAQVGSLHLPRAFAQKARQAVRRPRPLAELARAAPLRLRAFLLEQLLLSELASGLPSPARAAALQAFAAESQIPEDQVAALEVEAAQLHAEQQHWLEGAPAASPVDEEELAQDWEGFADEMMDRVATAVTENLEAIVTEIRETGELGQLLAKAAGGHTLTADERVKVKAQLIDLAKAVPALAIFAAPGGMLLLPLLAKLLPFNVLPSAWDHKEKRGSGGKGGAPPRP